MTIAKARLIPVNQIVGVYILNQLLMTIRSKGFDKVQSIEIGQKIKTALGLQTLGTDQITAFFQKKKFRSRKNNYICVRK